MTRLTEPAIFALVFWIVVWACVARAESIPGPYVMQPPLTAPVDQAYMRIDPTIKPQLDRIEKMLRAICQQTGLKDQTGNGNDAMHAGCLP